MNQEVTIYLDFGGTIYLANEAQMALFNLLGKLGCKNVPQKKMTVLTSYNFSMAGTYTISYTTNANSIIQNQSQQITISGTTIVEPQLKVAKVEKNYKTVSRQEKKSWHTTQKKHSQNTGLKLKLAGKH